MRRIRILHLLIVLAMLLSALPMGTAVMAQDKGDEGLTPEQEKLLKEKELQGSEVVPRQAAQPQPLAPMGPVLTGRTPDEALKIIEPDLRATAQEGGPDLIKITALVKPGTDISRFFTRHLLRKGSEFDRVIGLAAAGDLIKLASAPGVLAVLTMEEHQAPEPPQRIPGMEGAETPSRIQRGLDRSTITPRALDKEAFKQSLQQARIRQAAGSAAPESFFTEDTNGVRATWALGITGAGAMTDTLKLGVVDTGVDFANPDLFGTQARVTSPGSPYFDPAGFIGWPIAFDDRSMSDYALDIRDYRGNWGWYMNTNVTVTVWYNGVSTTTVGAFQDPSLAVTTPFTIVVYHPDLGQNVTYTISSTIQGWNTNGGWYRFGWHPDDSLANAIGESAGVLLSEENFFGTMWGPFDTVYVDMLADYTFDGWADGWATLGQEIACLNLGWSSPGRCDLSGGMVYYISNGTTPVPASDWLYGLGAPGPGEVVAFMLNDATENGYEHGTLCAGTAVGQGNITQMPYPGTYGDIYWPPAWYNPLTDGGISQGPGQDTSLVAMGNFYAGGSSLNYYDFAALGYDGIPAGAPGDNWDQVHLYTNSYGSGSVENDGWDLSSRYITLINYGFVAQQAITLPLDGAFSPLFVGSTGNSGFGYGTVTSPQPETGVMAGVSTVFGQYNLGDTALFRDWVNWGQLGGFSDRGPTSMSTLGVHVLSNGFFGSGNLPLNYLTGGDWAVDFWAGTSRSGPEVGGILALIYDAFWQQFGRYPSWAEARSLLMNGARPAYSDPKAQGAGLANALNAVEIILGTRGLWTVAPSGNSYWIPGTYRGTKYPGFARGLFSGESETVPFQVRNMTTAPVTAAVDAVTLEMYDSRDWNFTTLPLSVEGGGGYYGRRLYGPPGSNPGYGATDPFFDSTSPTDTALLQDADVMVVRLSYPFEQFQNNPGANWFFIYAYAWRDVHIADSTWFTDTNGNGYLNSGEFQDELVRINYDYHGNTAEIRIREPWKLLNGIVGPNEPPLAVMDDIIIMPRHFYYGGFDTTDLKVTVELYKEVPWSEIELGTDRVVVPPSGIEVFTATANTIVEGTVYLNEDFEAWPPAGWTIVDNGGVCVWDSTANTGRPNYAGGNGEAADADSDNCGDAMDTELWTPVMDLSGATNVVLDFIAAYNDYSINDSFEVDVSSDGGTTWTNVLSWDVDHDPYGPGEAVQIDLMPFRSNQVVVRFHYVGDYDWYAEVDDVVVHDVIIEPPGEYAGFIKLTYTTPYTYAEYVPVEKQIWFPTDIDPTLGGVDQPYLYDNGVMFGATGPSSSGQRAESGDWRFFFTDIIDPPDPGTYLLAHTTWQSTGTPPDATDIDTLFYGPVGDDFSASHPFIFGPHSLEVKGGSLRAGSAPDWEYYTTSGGPDDWSSIPLKDAGLHAVAAQVTRWGGESTRVPYTITIGTVQATPEVYINGLTCMSCTVPIFFKTNHEDLAGLALEAVGYGFNRPVHERPSVAQGATYVYTYTITAADAYKLQVNTSDPGDPNADIDLAVYLNGVLVGSSGRSDSNEQVILTQPAAGDYRIEVYGYAIPLGVTDFDLDIVEVSGEGAMTVTGLPTNIQLGVQYDMDLHFETMPPVGRWMGVLMLGPAGSPTAIEIPVVVEQGGATKTAWQDQVLPGELVTFTIAITESAGPLQSWMLEDVIPAGFEFVSVDGAMYFSPTHMIRWENCVAPWIDASTPLTLTSNDDGYAVINSPFDMIFFTNTFTTGSEIRISTNGYATFGTDGTDYSNDDIPDTLDPNGYMAPFWDDQEVDSGDASQGLWYGVYGSPGDHLLVMRWRIQDLGTVKDPNNYQVQVYEGSGDIWFVYDDMNEASDGWGDSATIGLENITGTVGTKYSYNTVSISDTWAIHFAPNVTGTYDIAYAGPRCYPFGSHVITLTLRAVQPGFWTNTASVNTGPNSCPISDTVMVAGAIPTWDKDILINGTVYGPEDSPYTVVAGDEVVIVDRVMVTSDDPITYTLVETYTTSLDLVDVDVTFGTVATATIGSVVWDVSGGISGTWYILTKTFTVNGMDWVDFITETLTVVGGPDPQVIPLEFGIPAGLIKVGPPDAYPGDVITYTIVVETPDGIVNHPVLTDVLPAGLAYAGGVTSTYGVATYNASDNAVYWTTPTPLLQAVQRPVSPVKGARATVKETDQPGVELPQTESPQIYSAVTTTLLSQGFEDGVMPPSGWSVISSTAASRHWTIVDAVTYPNFVHSGDYAGWVNYEAADQDEWLISPLIDLGQIQNPMAEFWVYANNYWVSYAELQFLVISNGGTVTDTLWQQSSETWPYPSAYHQVAVDLSAYAGSPVQLAWRYVGNNGDSIGLDDIVVAGEPPTTVTITFQVTVTAPGGSVVTNTAELDYNGVYQTASDYLDVLQSCTVLTDVNLSLVTTGTIETGDLVAFSADLLPDAADKPYSYTVDYGDGSPVITGTSSADPLSLTHTYSQSGTYTVEVAAWNCEMGPEDAVTDTVSVSVTEAVTPCTDITGVTLSRVSADKIIIGEPEVFSVDVTPANATAPFSYTLVAVGGTVYTASTNPFTFTVTFSQVGAQTVSIWAWNCTMATPVSDTLDVDVYSRLYLPLVLRSQ